MKKQNYGEYKFIFVLLNWWLIHKIFQIIWFFERSPSTCQIDGCHSGMSRDFEYFFCWKRTKILKAFQGYQKVQMSKFKVTAFFPSTTTLLLQKRGNSWKSVGQSKEYSSQWHSDGRRFARDIINYFTQPSNMQHINQVGCW